MGDKICWEALQALTADHSLVGDNEIVRTYGFGEEGEIARFAHTNFISNL